MNARSVRKWLKTNAPEFQLVRGDWLTKQIDELTATRAQLLSIYGPEGIIAAGTVSTRDEFASIQSPELLIFWSSVLGQLDETNAGLAADPYE